MASGRSSLYSGHDNLYGQSSSSSRPARPAVEPQTSQRRGVSSNPGSSVTAPVLPAVVTPEKPSVQEREHTELLKRLVGNSWDLKYHCHKLAYDPFEEISLFAEDGKTTDCCGFLRYNCRGSYDLLFKAHTLKCPSTTPDDFVHSSCGRFVVSNVVNVSNVLNLESVGYEAMDAGRVDYFQFDLVHTPDLNLFPVHAQDGALMVMEVDCRCPKAGPAEMTWTWKDSREFYNPAKGEKEMMFPKLVWTSRV